MDNLLYDSNPNLAQMLDANSTVTHRNYVNVGKRLLKCQVNMSEEEFKNVSDELYDILAFDNLPLPYSVADLSQLWSINNLKELDYHQKTEILCDAIVYAFGYEPNDLNCTDSVTALNHLYTEECNGEATKFIIEFIQYCDVDEFINLKALYENLNHQINQ